MSDFTDREMLRQMKTMNTHLKRIAKSLNYLETCFKPIRGKYKMNIDLEEGGSDDVSEEVTED